MNQLFNVKSFIFFYLICFVFKKNQNGILTYPPAQGVPNEIVNNYNNVSTVITTVSQHPNIRKGSGTNHNTYNDKRNDICTTIFLQLLGQPSLSYTHYVFTFSLCCFGFRVKIYISFYILGCPISCRKRGCSNNTPLMINNKLSFIPPMRKKLDVIQKACFLWHEKVCHSFPSKSHKK